jgi:uncharacterized NAD(P)/FAD-binding protein YdhS/predicted metal-dependent enzyme (double-stranded beta helix superfamily)
MRGRRQLLGLLGRWDALDGPIPNADLIASLEALRVECDDLADVIGFDDGCYRRTIIHCRPHYQVLVLCWRSGQRSPIHDHRGSNCAVRVIRGRAIETRFDATPSGRLVPTCSQEHSEGTTTACCGEEIHQMGNFDAPGRDLVTLHVYSPPPLRWRFYEVGETTLADHDRLIRKPARTVRAGLAFASGRGDGPHDRRNEGRSAMSDDTRRSVVAVIGGGFTGTMVAVHLARLAGSSPVRIVLLERGPRLARGLAYGTRCERHLLNVPAGMMSALPEEPSHFLDWLQASDPEAHAGTFAPRRTYGDYLEDLLLTTAKDASVPVELLHDEAIALEPGPGADREITIRTQGGRTIAADRVVLALGNQPPQELPGLAGRHPIRRYAADPWGPQPLRDLAGDEPIALIGSGLTAVDVVLEAHERGHRGPIYAISRHGLLPRRHCPAPPRPHFDLAGRAATARTLLRTVRAEAVACQSEGGDWRSVVDGLRPVAQTIWRSMPADERRRFVRHVASHWDAHRHRVAPEVDDVIQARLREGRLTAIPGRVLDSRPQGDGIALTIQRRGQSRTESLAVHLVVNCTGPARDIRRTSSKLLRSLLADGLARPGPLALGLDVDDAGALIGADGRSDDRLYAIGPLLKDHLWETTAVRELRVQAAELARRLLGRG